MRVLSRTCVYLLECLCLHVFVPWCMHEHARARDCICMHVCDREIEMRERERAFNFVLCLPLECKEHVFTSQDGFMQTSALYFCSRHPRLCVACEGRFQILNSPAYGKDLSNQITARSRAEVSRLP